MTLEDLSLEDREEIHALAGRDTSTPDLPTPGECARARDMHEAGDTAADIAELLDVDQRALTVHLEGHCNCETRRGGR